MSELILRNKSGSIRAGTSLRKHYDLSIMIYKNEYKLPSNVNFLLPNFDSLLSKLFSFQNCYFFVFKYQILPEGASPVPACPACPDYSCQGILAGRHRCTCTCGSGAGRQAAKVASTLAIGSPSDTSRWDSPRRLPAPKVLCIFRIGSPSDHAASRLPVLCTFRTPSMGEAPSYGGSPQLWGWDTSCWESPRGFHLCRTLKL